MTVEVVTRGKNTSIMEELRNLEEAGATLRILPTKTKNFHSKIMLIKGIWEGEKAKIILCGSQNFTGSALRLNNEDYLMLKNSILFDDYWNYFLMLKNG